MTDDEMEQFVVVVSVDGHSRTLKWKAERTGESGRPPNVTGGAGVGLFGVRREGDVSGGGNISSS